MPVTKSAKKALRGSLRKREINVRTRSQMKTAVDAFRRNPTAEGLAQAFSRLDRAVKNHLLHRNTAARRKSGLSRLLVAAK